MPPMVTVNYGYRDCLEEFDARIPEIIENMCEDDLLMITGLTMVMILPTLVLTILVNISLFLIFGKSYEYGHIPVGHFCGYLSYCC